MEERVGKRRWREGLHLSFNKFAAGVPRVTKYAYLTFKNLTVPISECKTTKKIKK